MNLVLFEPAELAAPLPRTDPRAQHVLNVLRRREGDTFDAALIDGALGKATLVALAADTITLAFTPTRQPPPLPLRHLIVGLPRPQTARDILRDATTLGATCIQFVMTERTDPGYARSTLWTSGEWRRHVLAGAAQAFDSRLPAVRWDQTLTQALATATGSPIRLALDNYEAPSRLAAPSATTAGDIALAIGPERGWGPTDRAALRAAGFALHNLGPRVLRTETAVTAALAILAPG